MKDHLKEKIEAFRDIALIYTAVQLRLPDLIENGVNRLDALVDEMDCSSESLARLMSSDLRVRWAALGGGGAAGERRLEQAAAGAGARAGGAEGGARGGAAR